MARDATSKARERLAMLAAERLALRNKRETTEAVAVLNRLRLARLSRQALAGQHMPTRLDAFMTGMKAFINESQHINQRLRRLELLQDDGAPLHLTPAANGGGQ